METESRLRLADVFVSITDPRQASKTRHDLVEVLVVAVNGVMAGADTFVAPLVIAENTSEAVESYVLRLKPGELTTSLWTQVELASLVSRKVRMGELTVPEAKAVRGQFDRMLAESFELLIPAAVDFAAATKFLAMPKIGLRSADALHLAIAANQGAKKILTLDAGFIDAGKLLKLPVSRGIRV